MQPRSQQVKERSVQRQTLDRQDEWHGVGSGTHEQEKENQ